MIGRGRRPAGGEVRPVEVHRLGVLLPVSRELVEDRFLDSATLRFLWGDRRALPWRRRARLRLVAVRWRWGVRLGGWLAGVPLDRVCGREHVDEEDD